MTELEKYEKVQSAESLEQLAKVIKSFADKDGLIQGRTYKFDAEKMALDCLFYDLSKHNTLT